MLVYKKVVCQWPPFGTNFLKGDSISSNQEHNSNLPDKLAPAWVWGSCFRNDLVQFSSRKSTNMCDEDETKAKNEKVGKPAIVFLGMDTNHLSLLQLCVEKCFSFVSCYHARLPEWLLNLGEKLVSPEKNWSQCTFSRT